MVRNGAGAALGVLAALLFTLDGRAAAAAPVVSDELDLTQLAGSAAQPPSGPAVAFDGSRHLLVWEESGDVLAALLDADGRILSAPARIAVPSEPLQLRPSKASPVVAAGPGGFLVAWTETGIDGTRVRAARVSADGLVLDATGFDVSPPGGAHAAVAMGGGEVLVAWEDGRADPLVPRVYAARVVGASVVQELAIAPAGAGPQRRPAVAADGGGWLVVWEDGRNGLDADVYGARVASDGTIGAELAVSTAAGDQLSPVLSASASGQLVLWSDHGSGSFSDLLGSRIGPGGVLDPAPIRVASSAAPDVPHAVASDGEGFLAVFEPGALALYGARVGADGAVDTDFPLDGSSVVPPGQALAFGGAGRFLATYLLDTAGTTRLAARLVTVPYALTLAKSGSGTGLVSSTPAGIECGATCSAEFLAGTSVSLTATPVAGSELTGWTGCVPGPDPATCTVSVAGRAAVTAAFAPALPGAPAAPTYESVTASTLTVTWGAVPFAVSYKLERAPDATGAPGAFAQIQGALGTTTFNETGRTANTRYWYRVRAVNAAGDGPYSGASSVVTVPRVPGAPTFSARTNAGVTVAWSAPLYGAASYDLERAPDVAGVAGAYAQVAAGLAATTWTDAGLAASTRYWYRVRASNAEARSSDFSAGASVLTTPDPPASAPTFSNVTTTTVTVSWVAVPGATGYRLERASDVSGAPSTSWTTLAPTGTSYGDTGRTANATYWYRVRATSDGTNFSPPSSASSIVMVPNVPTSVRFGSIQTTSVVVSWYAPTYGAASYDVERAPDVGGSAGAFVRVASGIAGTSFTDGGLSPGLTWWYRVRANNVNGLAGDWSAAASLLTLPPAPEAPGFADVTTASLTVTWQPVTSATSYKLERAPDVAGSPGDFSQIASGINGTSRADTLRSPNTRYWYRLRATNASGDGPYSPASPVVTLPNAPAWPTPPFTAVGLDVLTVNWVAPTGGASAYEVERAPDAAGVAGPFTRVAASLAALQYTDSTVAADTTYWYRVRALNSAGLPGAYNVARSVTTVAPTLIAAPGNPTYSGIQPTTLNVTWTAVAGADGYKVERSADGGATWLQISNQVSTVKSDAGLAANRRYWYRVRGFNSGGDGPYSGVTSVLTLPLAPAAPTFSAIGPTSVTVSWAAPTGGADAYEVERASSSTGPWAQRAAIPATAFEDAPLTPNTPYFYRVRATNASGAGAYSPVASVTTATDTVVAKPDAPGAPTFTVSSISVTVRWTAAAGATSYRVEVAPDANGPGPWALAATGVTSTSYTNSGRTPNTRYWYRVTGANAGGEGPPSPEADAVTLTSAPGAPTFSEATASRVVLSWTAPAGGVTSYAIERAPESTGPWTTVQAGLGATTWSDVGVVGNTAYWYRVRGVNLVGAPGSVSSARSVTTALDPAAVPPAGAPVVTATGTTTSTITVAWGAVAGATSYTLERAADAAGQPATSWTEIGTELTGTSYADGARSANTRYWYRARAWSAGGTGPTSSPTSGVTLPNAPGAPTFTAVTSSSVTVNWTAPSRGASSYEVERAATSAGPWIPVAAVTSLSVADPTVGAGATYWYRVRAVNAAGGQGAYSSARSVATATAPPAG